MNAPSLDSFRARRVLSVGSKSYTYYSLPAAMKAGLPDIRSLPFSLRVLVENLLRHEDGESVRAEDIAALAEWKSEARRAGTRRELAFRPARVLMQDLTGVPAVVDLAAMRDALAALGGDPRRINPLAPVDLVIDHSVMVDKFASPGALAFNMARDYERNGERYAFLRWGAEAFSNFRVVPPGAGICHQVNLEYLARVVWTQAGRPVLAFPDTLVGTDSHTTMINGLGVLGWGVGGIEAEAAMLGQPVSMLTPQVVGVHLSGRLREGVHATDLVLQITETLRAKGVVGKFVEYCGPGLAGLALEDRATIANMSPEYGATCGFFPVDEQTLAYLRASARPAALLRLIETYARAQGLWRGRGARRPRFTEMVEIDLGRVGANLAGPKRPQDRIGLERMAQEFETALHKTFPVPAPERRRRIPVAGQSYDLGHGDVVIAAITSCTNTSNPRVMLGAGLLARNAVRAGLRRRPWVKTSLAPGSRVVADYLKKAGLQDSLNRLGFHPVGFGCTTCIGNSGPLAPEISEAIGKGRLAAAAVLSGNRNFEGRINPDVRANYLASPMLVVAYALAGSVRTDLTRAPLGTGKNGQPVFLRDIWPGDAQIAAALKRAIPKSLFRTRYADIFKGDAAWRRIKPARSLTYDWAAESTYVRHPPFFENMPPAPRPGPGAIRQARILALLGDSITTDHISPAGSIKPGSPAAVYLEGHAISRAQYNSFGARRGNHEVMMRGTFGNIRIRNQMVPGTEGGMTKFWPGGKVMPIYQAAMAYARRKTPLVVFAGREYGTGSSRDWAAKGTRLLGVRAVIAQSFERIHRSNLIGMGVLPLQVAQGDWRDLKLRGDEQISVTGLDEIGPGMGVEIRIAFASGQTACLPVLCRIDTGNEAAYYRHGGILHFVLRKLAA